MVYIYKETRVSLDWASEDQIAWVTVPDYDPSEDVSVTSEPKPASNGSLIKTSTDDFPEALLATSSSVLFRAIHQTPRTLLWRVMGDGKKLVLMPLDVARPAEGSEGVASAYEIRFSQRISAGCVTFHDIPETNTLMAFVLTDSHKLYTFSLRQSFFTGKDTDTRIPQDWCHIFHSSALSLRSPHFIQAVSGDSVLVALQDGGLTRLDRLVQHKSSSGYKEISFSDGGYFNSIKSIVRWGGAQVRYGDKSIAAATVVSAALIFRYSLLFTVSINHQLRVWSMDRGSVLGTYDLLNEPATSAPSIKNFLDPAPAHLVTLIDHTLDGTYMFLLLTLSPSGSGIFKLWGGTDDGTHGFTRLVDLYPNDELKLEPPTFNSAWVVADYGIAGFSRENPNLISMWLLWKSNTSSRMQTTTFDLQKMSSTFNNWVDASGEQLLAQKARSPPSGGPEELATYWLDWIFQPGRFSDSVIQRALDIYKKNFVVQAKQAHAMDVETTGSGESLQSLISNAVQTAVHIKRRQSIRSDDDDAVWRDFDTQWNTFFKICAELDKSRIEGLSLSVDPASGLAFVANADTLTVVRKSAESESISQNLATATTPEMMLLHNNASDYENSIFQDNLQGHVQSLILVARELKESLLPAIFDECVGALQDEVTQAETETVLDRIDSIFERCFEGRLPNSLTDHVSALLSPLSNNLVETFQAIILRIRRADSTSSSKLTVFGEKLLLRGSQEVVYVNYTLLFELTLLLILVHSTTVVEIVDLEPYNELYLQLIATLREYNILLWLSNNSWTPSPEDQESEEAFSKTLGQIRHHRDGSAPQIHNFPVLQILLNEESGPPPSVIGSGPVTLTSSIQRFLATTNLGDHSSTVTLIASRLLRMNAVRLMGAFMQYLPHNPWGQYLKGRMAICRREWHLAESLFKSAAPGIASPHQPPVSSLDALFTPIEIQYLCAGLPRFYFHVAELFEKSQKYDEVVVFSKLAYKALPKSRLDQDEIALRSDILSRQFSSALRVPDYDAAYAALVEYSDKALQRKALKSLVVAMCEHHEAEHMCEFDFPGLHEEVDSTLEQETEKLREVASASIPYHRILYAWRISKGNRRGAASALYDYLKKLQGGLTTSQRYTGKEVRNVYLALLNVLSLVPKEQAYVFTRLHAEQESSGVHFVDGTKLKRRVVTLDNIREEYQLEMRKSYEYLRGGIFF